jgi:hypothetical protein
MTSKARLTAIVDGLKGPLFEYETPAGSRGTWLLNRANAAVSVDAGGELLLTITEHAGYTRASRKKDRTVKLGIHVPEEFRGRIARTDRAAKQAGPRLRRALVTFATTEEQRAASWPEAVMVWGFTRADAEGLAMHRTPMRPDGETVTDTYGTSWRVTHLASGKFASGLTKDDAAEYLAALAPLTDWRAADIGEDVKAEVGKAWNRIRHPYTTETETAEEEVAA